MIFQRFLDWIIDTILKTLLLFRIGKKEDLQIPEKEIKKISLIAEENKITFNEAFNKCLRAGILIDDVHKDGGAVVIEDEEGEERTLKIFAEENPKIIHFKEKKEERKTKKKK